MTSRRDWIWWKTHVPDGSRYHKIEERDILHAPLKQISNLVDTIENRGGNSQLYQRLDTRENELKQLAAQLEGLDESFQDQLEFLNAPERIIACALDLRTYIESEDPEIARTFILSFVKNVAVLGNEATIHYGIPMPRDPTGNPNPTEAVSLNKNAKSCLPDTRTGIDRCLTLLSVNPTRFPHPRGDRPRALSIRRTHSSEKVWVRPAPRPPAADL